MNILKSLQFSSQLLYSISQLYPVNRMSATLSLDQFLKNLVTVFVKKIISYSFLSATVKS